MPKNSKKNLIKLQKVAENYRKKGQYSNAIKEYETLAKLFPQEKKVFNVLGDLYQLIRDKKNAIKNYTIYAKELEAGGFTLQAIAVYKKITRIDDEDPDVYQKLAELYSQQGIIAESISMFMHLAGLYQKKGLVRRAIALYEKVIDLQPDNLKIIALLADQYLKEGLKEEAIEKYIQFADILLKKDEWDKVRSIYSKILELDPDNLKVKKSIGNLYFQIGDYENAEKHLTHALEDFPESVDLMKDLGEVYIKIKDFSNAAGIFARLVDQVPDDISQRKKYAFILLNLKQETEAQVQLDYLVQKLKGLNNFEKIIDMMQDAKTLRKYFWYAYNTLIDMYSFLKQEANKLDTMKELSYRYIEKEKFSQAYEIMTDIKHHYIKDESFMAKYNEMAKKEEEVKKTSNEEKIDIFEDIHSDSVLDIEAHLEEELSFDIPSDLVSEEEEHRAEKGSDISRSVSKEIDEVNIPMDDFLDESKEDQIDIQDNFGQDELLQEEVFDIDMDDEALFEPEGQLPGINDSRLEISEAELEREIDLLELNESREIPFEKGSEVHIDKDEIVIEDLDVDLIDDESESEYDKSIDEVFDDDPPAVPQEEDAEDFFPEKEEKDIGLIKENLTEAEVFLKFGLTEKAYKHIKAALEIDPENIDALIKLKELYSLENKNKELIETVTKLIQLYKNAEDDEGLNKEFKFLKTIDPDNPLLKTASDSDEILYDTEEKDYGNLLEKLIKETDINDDFEVVSESEDESSSNVTDLLYKLRNDNIEEQEDIVQDLVEADDLFTDNTNDQTETEEEELDRPLQEIDLLQSVSNGQIAQKTEDIGDNIEDLSDEAISGDEMEIDSSLSDDFFELASPDDGEEPYDIGEEMGIFNPEELSDSDETIGQAIQEFKKGVQDQLSPEDYETHYNLGIAFKEMGLIDDAIESFEKAASTGKIMVESISMLGLCYIEQGMYQRAIDQFKKGLQYLEKDSDAYIGLIYELANVYEISNDNERAYIYFQEIMEKKNDFRDTEERLELLGPKIEKQKVDKIKNSIKEDIEQLNNPRISYI